MKKIILSFLFLSFIPFTSAYAIDWKKYDGREVNMICMTITWCNAVKDQLPKFKEKTGITVNLDLFEESAAHQKVRTELASGSGAYDIIWAQANWTIPYAKQGFLAPLQPLIDNKNITDDAVLNYDDMMSALTDLMKYEGDLYGLPFFAATIMTYYRADLLEEAGIDPIELDTIDGFVNAIKKLHNKDIAGVAMRGHAGEASWHQTVFMKGMGGKYFVDVKSEDYTPTFNTPEVIEAVKIYADLFINSSPAGAVNFKYTDVVLAMQQGNAAIIMEGAPLGGLINDPEKSTVRGKLGYAMVPKGPGGRHPAFTGHGLALASASKNLEPAWYFLQWALSKDVTLDIALNSNHVGVHRDSVWEDPTFREKWNLPAAGGDFLKTFQDSLNQGDPDYRPRISGWSEINTAYGEGIQKVILGQLTAEDAMDEVQSKAESVLKRLKYIK
jgi:multiple sugar transport system substrate-binding protein